MENEILLHVEGLNSKKDEDEITLELAQMIPGVELIQVNADKGTISITGGDIDILHVQDIVEALGYTALH